MTDVKKLIADFDLYFTSANSIDVDARISVPRDEWRALRTAIAQRLEADEWQPIETAPKDGSRLQLYFPIFGNSPHQEIGYFDKQEYGKKSNPYWSGDRERMYGVLFYRKYPPTHWKPLPKGPQ